MILFRSPLTMALLGAAVILLAGGAWTKKGHVLSFFGALLGAVSVVTALMEGAPLQEAMLCAFLALAVSGLTEKRGRGRGG